MKKLVQEKNKLIDELKKEDKMDVWWHISKEWMALPYEVKASFYWKYQYNSKGERIFPSTDITEKYN
jgi:hypothetical protein